MFYWEANHLITLYKHPQNPEMWVPGNTSYAKYKKNPGSLQNVHLYDELKPFAHQQ